MNRNTKIALFIGAITAVIAGSWLLINRQPVDYSETGHMMGYSNWGGLMMIFMILFWALIIWGIFWLVKSFAHSGQTDLAWSDRSSAVEVLKRRYAAGEISREEFEAKKHDIS